MDVIELIVGAVVGGIVGALIGVIPTYWFFYSQFSNGSGGHRMSMVKAATREFSVASSTLNTGAVQSKYRYGLGVIINELERMEPNGFKFSENKRLPTLISRGDPWERFNLYVRPIVDDINSYALLRVLPSSFKPVGQLAKLVDLCNQLEIVVMQLDAELNEMPKIIDWKKRDNSEEYDLVVIGDLSNERTKSLIGELKKLGDCWTAWKDSIGIRSQRPI